MNPGGHFYDAALDVHRDVRFMVEACEPQNRQPKTLQGSIKTGKRGEFRERGGPGPKSGLASSHLSDLGKALEGP